MARPSISYKSLLDVCETTTNNSACLNIANILIDNSHSLMSKSFGYKLKINTVKMIGDKSEAEKIEIQYENFIKL